MDKKDDESDTSEIEKKTVSIIIQPKKVIKDHFTYEKKKNELIVSDNQTKTQSTLEYLKLFQDPSQLYTSLVNKYIHNSLS